MLLSYEKRSDIDNRPEKKETRVARRQFALYDGFIVIIQSAELETTSGSFRYMTQFKSLIPTKEIMSALEVPVEKLTGDGNRTYISQISLFE